MTTATAPVRPAPPPSTAPAVDELRRIPLTDLRESPWNPRKHFDPARLAEMAESLKKGQLAPIIVRQMPNARGELHPTKYEIGAGHRRFRSAPAAGLTSLLAIVRPLADVEFLELLTIENKQRDDVTPLDEAAGFKLLMEKAGYDVGKLSARIGLSVKYVYDRLKLLQLIPEAKKYLEDGTITAGHAILLARLKPTDQKRIMGDPKRTNRYDADAGGGLFQGESADHDPDQPGLELERPVKARSVRELATYINDHVRFRPEETDPVLFPETVAALTAATTDDLKVIHITYDHITRDDARDAKNRTYSVVSWKRADGKEKSKTCAFSGMGVVVAGPDRGDAFRVCVNRDKCPVHFPEAARARRAKKQQSGATAPKAESSWIRQEAQRKEADAREAAERERWTKAMPKLLAALAEKIAVAPTGSTGELGQTVLAECAGYGGAGTLGKYLSIGRTAEDVVRRAAFLVIAKSFHRGYDMAARAARELKVFGINAKKIVDEVAPPAAPEKAPAKKPAKKGAAK